MTVHVRRWQLFSTVAILALSIVSTLLGLFREGHYNDAPELLARMQAIDATILAVAVPVLAIGLWLAHSGSVRGQVIWVGALAYMTYQWASIAGQTAFNQFYLGYVVLFALSLFTLVGAVLDLDPESFRRTLDGRISRRVYAGFLAFVAVGLSALWLSDVVPSMIAGTTPQVIEELGELGTHTYLLDLGVVVPAVAIAAVWIWRGRAWGYAVTGVLLVLAALLTPSLTAITVVDVQSETVTITLPLLLGTVVPPVVGALFAVRYLLALPRREALGSPDTRETGRQAIR